jgi:hypothetical protein
MSRTVHGLLRSMPVVMHPTKLWLCQQHGFNQAALYNLPKLLLSFSIPLLDKKTEEQQKPCVQCGFFQQTHSARLALTIKN